MSRANDERLRLGTRGSTLARWQADWVSSRLEEFGCEVERVLITTGGDTDSRPIGSIGGQGLFTKEIQRALLEDRIDLAVHSLKDLPTDPVEGLTLAATPVRESPFDALVAGQTTSVDRLPKRARVGTGSQRRRSQLLHLRPDLEVADIRGNVDTRLRKLADSEFDAIILAEAGLIRLGLTDRISAVLPAAVMMPAVGQGALGLECRTDDSATRSALVPLNDAETHSCVLAERALLAELLGGCSAPIGAWCRVDETQLHLEAVVLSVDGQQRLFAQTSGPLDCPEAAAAAAANDLLSQGAAKLVDASR